MELSAVHAIRHARVPAHLARRVDLRSRLEHWLAGCDPRRAGLPAEAIVLVRALEMRWSELAGPAHAAGALESALAAAVRPAHAAVGAAAPAVWFADEAELLACLARDALAGRLAGCWWWRALLPGGADAAAAARRWIDTPRAVPHAASRLEAAGDGAAARWFAALGEPARNALIAGLARAFPIAGAVRRHVMAPRPVGERDSDGDGETPHAGAVRVDDPAPPETAGAVWVDSAADRLRRLCLDLAAEPDCARDPAWVRRGSHAHAPLPYAGARRTAPARDGGAVTAQQADRRSDAAAAVAAVPAPAPLATAVSLSLRAQAGRLPAAPPSPAALPVQGGASGSAFHRAGAPDVEMPRPQAQPGRRHAVGASPAGAGAAGPAGGPHADGASAAGAGDDAFAAVVFDSGFGGLLFLLNAALQLGLFGDFTRPLQRGLAASPWRLLHDAGRALGGAAFRADALCAWLARQPSHNPLATGPSMPLPEDAAGSLDAAVWCIDPAWLALFAPAAGHAGAVWRTVFDGARLRVLHPAGFAVFDAPARHDDDCRSLLHALAARPGAGWAALAAPVVQHHRGAAAPRAARRRGGAARSPALGRLLPYLRARIALALGLPNASAAVRLLTRLPARVRVAGGRLDAQFPLDALPLAVRLAGLDRDPGWIPAAGCDIRFHFH